MATQDSAAEAEPIGTIQRYTEAFNQADEEGMAACFATAGFILDGMAPHVWSGPAATRLWFRDAMAESEHVGVSDFAMTLGDPLHHNVTGDAAYCVVPATLAFKVKGQPINQTGAYFTVALREVDGAWLIAAWAWTKGSGGGVNDAAGTVGPGDFKQNQG